ncbi:MAG: MFS transporter [Burkholderiales bacterium]|nr:MFS transporter [Burkholderiales bacterium]
MLAKLFKKFNLKHRNLKPELVNNTAHDKIDNFQPTNPKILALIFFTIFIDLVGVGILIPVFPLLILPGSEFKVTPNSWSTQQGYILLGYLAAAFPFAQFICSPILGQLADRYGRKKILALSIFGTSVTYILFAIGVITKNIPLMFISRILDGCTGGNISVAQAVIADISTPKNRAKNFGLVGMSFGLGFIFGPFLGGKLSDPATISWFNAATPFYFAAALSILNVTFVLKFLPETLKITKSSRIDITRPFNNIAKAFSYHGLRNVMPATFLFNSGFTFFSTFFAIILASKYGFTQGHIGNYFAYIGIMIVCAQMLVIRRISGKVNDYSMLRFSMFGTAICLLVYYFIPSNHAHLIYFVPPFMATFNALTFSFNAALVTRVTPSNIHGESLGINSSIMALAQTIPAIIAGYIATINSNLPIFVGSGIIFLGGLSFWWLFKPNNFKVVAPITRSN